MVKTARPNVEVHITETWYSLYLIKTIVDIVNYSL